MMEVTADSRAQRFSNKSDLNELHKELTRRRELEIKQSQAAGLVDDLSAKRTLDQAIDIVGTCEDFCPYYEKVERHLRNEVKRPEMKPGTDEPDYSRMIKAFTRPNDSNTTKLPSEIRPPHVLQRTADYLFHELLPQASSWISVQEFIFDRTRAIRQDFTIQGDRSQIGVECHERIARFHILSLHESKIGSIPDEDWESELRAAYSLTLDIAQLNKTLTTLMQFYDDFRSEGVTFPNEAEFRAYRLLLQLRDGDVARRTQRIPFDVLSSPWIQAALDLRNLAQHPSSVKTQHPGPRATPYVFTRILKEIAKPTTTFLMACLMESHFMLLRKEALRAMTASYMSKTTSLDKISRLLGFETEEQAADFVKDCGLKGHSPIDLRSGWKGASVEINKTERRNITEATPKEAKVQSYLLVHKRGGAAWQDIIDGRLPGPLPKGTAPAPRVIPSVLQPPSILPNQFGGQFTSTSSAANPFAPQQLPATSGVGGFGGFSAGFGTRDAGVKSAAISVKPTFPFGSSNSSAFGAISFGTSSQPSSSKFATSTTSLFAPPPLSAVKTASIPLSMTPTPPIPNPPTEKPELSSFGSGTQPSATSAPGSSTFKLSSAAAPFVPKFGLPAAPKPYTEPRSTSPKRASPVPSETIPPLATVASKAEPAQRSPVLARKPSVTIPRKVSLPVPQSPVPSPRTISKQLDEKNTLIASNILEVLLKGVAQVEVAGSFADEWRRRRKLTAALLLWRDVAMETRQVRDEEEERLAKLEKERSDRWGRLMKTLDGENSSQRKPTSKKWKGKEKELVQERGAVVAASVEEMQYALEEAARARKALWESGTFMTVVREKVLRNPRSSKWKDGYPDDWSVWLCGSGGPTWSWLKVKFGYPVVEGAPEVFLLQIPLSDEGIQHHHDLYPGVIIIELSPSLATSSHSEREGTWQNELRRASKILSQLPRDQRYQPAILILYWADAASDIDEQREDVTTRIEGFLQNSRFAVSAAGLVMFKSPETYHEDFETALATVTLDTAGHLVPRYRFEDVLTPFVNAWEDLVTDALTLANTQKAELSLNKYAIINHILSALIEGLASLESRICDVLELVVDDPLSSFPESPAASIENLQREIINYLSGGRLAEDIMIGYLVTELQRTFSASGEIPVRRILDQIAWHVSTELRSLGSDIIGDEWKEELEQLKADLQAIGESLAVFIEENVPAAPRALPNGPAKKRGRVSSSDRTPPAVKKARPSEPNTSSRSDLPLSEPVQPPSPKPFLKSELADLERLLAESEAMLAR